MARYFMMKEAVRQMDGPRKLRLQWGFYAHDNGELVYGYRFVWTQDGRLESARGQARLPSLAIAYELMEQAKAEGWGDNTGECTVPDPIMSS